MFTLYVWPFLIYFLIFFTVCYIVVEYGQNYFYDEVTPGAGVKVALGALILAVLLTVTRSNFATMFTSDIGPTVLLAIVGSGIFILIFRFQPWHGFGMAMASLLIFAGMSTLVVDSMLAPKSAERIDTTVSTKLPRRSASGSAVPTPTPPPAPASTPAAPKK
jgi:hypothetical protein